MSDEMVTRVGYDPLVRVLDRLDKMLTAAGSPPETPHEEAVGALIAERDRLREALHALCWHAIAWRSNGWVPATGALDDACELVGREALEMKP